MSTSPLDLSTFKPLPAAQPAAGGGLDMSTFKPAAGSAPAVAPAADLFANPNSEGLYQMKHESGEVKQVPYSNVERALQSGYRLPGGSNLMGQPTGELGRYTKDKTNDPKFKSAVTGAVSNATDLPLENLGKGALKSAAQGIGGLMQIVHDHVGSGGDPADVMDYKKANPHASDEEALQAIEGGYRGETTTKSRAQLKEAAQFLQDNPQHGFWQNLGGVGETVGELLSGLGIEDGTAEGKVMSFADRIGARLKTAKFLEQNPKIAKLAAIGAKATHAAVKGAAEAGGQTYVHTGGDADAAGTAAELGGAAGAGLSAAGDAISGVRGKLASVAGETGPATTTVEGVELPKPKGADLTPEQQAAATAYSRTAREAGRPHLEAIGEDPWVVDSRLQELHDFTGVANELKAANNARGEALNNATGGRFKTLNAEVGEAQQAAFRGGEAEEKVYQNKMREMQDLLDKTPGGSKEAETLKKSWRQSYILSDAGKMLDRSLDGIPGESGISRQQRGINGKKLQTGLQSLVRRYGYDTVDTALGQGRLKGLEAIAEATKTNAGRQEFNTAIGHIAKAIGGASIGGSVGHAVGHAVGGTAGGYIGGSIGAAAGARSEEAMRRVIDAVRTNPKIAQNLLFAIDSGASPDRYAPMIAGMISHVESDGEK